MSGGSQHNPNGRQPQLGPAWSPLQLQMASYLARAPQAHIASDRGVTWHTPTPPHLYHVPVPSPPDPLQAMKATAAANSVFRHTATPPELYRHTPTPPDKHHMRHTPSPGDAKAAGASMPPAELFPIITPSRDKTTRPEEQYNRSGVDLSVSRNSNGAPLALSVRDAPTINSLIARAAQPRIDAILDRIAPAPVGVIVHNPRSPTDSPQHKRKRKPERTSKVAPVNGRTSPAAETLDDIAAMVAAEDHEPPIMEPEQPVVDKLESVLGSPEAEKQEFSAENEATQLNEDKEPDPKTVEPTLAEPEASSSFVEVENRLEQMFAGIEEPTKDEAPQVMEQAPQITEQAPKTKDEAPRMKKSETEKVEPVRKRRKSVATKAEKKSSDKRKPGRKREVKEKKDVVKDNYDSGSNASSNRSKGPYIQIRGPSDSPVTVSVVNGGGACEDEETPRRRDEYKGKTRGLLASTLGRTYDASTADSLWRCAFCNLGPHAAPPQRLGDLFGPYDEGLWLHAPCAVWAPGLLAAGARLRGLSQAMTLASRSQCCICSISGATLVCQRRGCNRASHLPCARQSRWTLDEQHLTANCDLHS